MKKLLVIALVLMNAPLQAANDSVATTSVPFLKLGAGARALAMGEAYSALADDATALYWNPAALVNTPHHAISLMHASYLQDTSYDYAAYARTTRDSGTFAVGWQYFSAGRIAQTDDYGSDQGDFKPTDLALSVGYGYRFQDVPFLVNYAVGGSLKYINSSIISSAHTWTTDLAMLSPSFGGYNWRWSLVLANVGGHLSYDQATESIPRWIRFGQAIDINRDWHVTFDTTFPNDNHAYVATGLERSFSLRNQWFIALRGGLNSRTWGDYSGWNGATTGIGLEIGQSSIDYAFLPYGELGATHRFSLSYRWGAPNPKNNEVQLSSPSPVHDTDGMEKLLTFE